LEETPIFEGKIPYPGERKAVVSGKIDGAVAVGRDYRSMLSATFINSNGVKRARRVIRTSFSLQVILEHGSPFTPEPTSRIADLPLRG
jgi:hypothetical protein